MRTQRDAMTPLAAVVGGFVAGVAGTAGMDTVQYLLYRRAGGRERPLTWEFPSVDRWEKAPDPGNVAKRLIDGFTGRELPDRWAGLTSTGAAFRLFAGRITKPRDAGSSGRPKCLA